MLRVWKKSANLYMWLQQQPFSASSFLFYALRIYNYDKRKIGISYAIERFLPGHILMLQIRDSV